MQSVGKIKKTGQVPCSLALRPEVREGERNFMYSASRNKRKLDLLELVL